MIMQLSYGQQNYLVEVQYAERKDLKITVHPDLRITASAPLNVSQEQIEKRLNRRSRWIGKQVRYFEQFLPQTPPRRYLSGESHYYLGRQYRLKIDSGPSTDVKLLRGYFRIQLPDVSDTEKIKQLLESWYQAHFKQLIEKRMLIYWPRFEKLKAKQPVFRYRHMTRSWGSCSIQGIISLNLELSRMPLECIDYVLVHELCHLLCPHHNDQFYRLLNRAMPDWKKRKAKLEGTIE
jgi:predicted metal-dependent hydrolase